MPFGPLRLRASTPADGRRSPPLSHGDSRRLRDELTSYALSFVLHLALLVSLTLTAVVHLTPGRPPALVVSMMQESSIPGGGVLDDVVPVEIVAVAPAYVETEQLSPEISAALFESTRPSPQVARSSDRPASPSPSPPPGGDRAQTRGVGDGADEATRGDPGPFGTRIDLPPKAVHAGNFAAWWIPKVERYGERVEPGQLPRVGQAYRIFVQMAVPPGRETLRVEDLSGEIVGTDGYRQLIPERAWITDEQGNLLSAVGRRGVLPVRGGVVELAFKVDGAGRAGVRDTIRIRSRVLNEEQILTLEFAAAPRE